MDSFGSFCSSCTRRGWSGGWGEPGGVPRGCSQPETHPRSLKNMKDIKDVCNLYYNYSFVIIVLFTEQKKEKTDFFPKR